MDNNEVIKSAKKYLRQYKTVDMKWFVQDKLVITKDSRELDIIVQGILNSPWFTQYSGHNKDDISIKYTPWSMWSFFIGLIGGAVGLIGGILGIISFFYKA